MAHGRNDLAIQLLEEALEMDDTNGMTWIHLCGSTVGLFFIVHAEVNFLMHVFLFLQRAGSLQLGRVRRVSEPAQSLHRARFARPPLPAGAGTALPRLLAARSCSCLVVCLLDQELYFTFET